VVCWMVGGEVASRIQAAFLALGEAMITRRRMLLFGLPAALVLLGVGAWMVWGSGSQENPTRNDDG
jgi:hypothetical protein